jgi:hypothetical protein
MCEEQKRKLRNVEGPGQIAGASPRFNAKIAGALTTWRRETEVELAAASK